jgi:hypothetical protein
MTETDSDAFTTAELRERLVNPSGPEDWSDVIAALADRLSASLMNRRPEMPIDEAAIVRNFAATIIDMRLVVEGFVGNDSGHMEDDWLAIKAHLDGAADGLTDIAQGWI